MQTSFVDFEADEATLSATTSATTSGMEDND
jgi:hypothetical protein